MKKMMSDAHKLKKLITMIVVALVVTVFAGLTEGCDILIPLDYAKVTPTPLGSIWGERI